jgi:hypothetical protein
MPLSGMALDKSFLYWTESNNVHKISASAVDGTSSIFFKSSSDLNAIAVYRANRDAGKSTLHVPFIGWVANQLTLS